MTSQADEIVASDVEVKTKSGRVFRFARFTLVDWAKVQRTLENKHKGELRSKVMILKEAGLNTELLPAAIRQMSLDATARETVNYMHTPEGAIKVFEIAAEKAGVDLTDDFADQFDDPFDLIDIATDIANLNPSSRSPDNGKDRGDDDDPLADGSTART
jgi:hypothetical protein